jgi:hypothetical protein
MEKTVGIQRELGFITVESTRSTVLFEQLKGIIKTESSPPPKHSPYIQMLT